MDYGSKGLKSEVKEDEAINNNRNPCRSISRSRGTHLLRLHTDTGPVRFLSSQLLRGRLGRPQRLHHRRSERHPQVPHPERDEFDPELPGKRYHNRPA